MVTRFFVSGNACRVAPWTASRVIPAYWLARVKFKASGYVALSSTRMVWLGSTFSNASVIVVNCPVPSLATVQPLGIVIIFGLTGSAVFLSPSLGTFGFSDVVADLL